MTSDTQAKSAIVIAEICRLRWQSLVPDEMVSVVWAYYHVSVQFRENLQIARRLYPADNLLRRLEQEECATDNLSPWPGIAEEGEKIDHDEFLRRALQLNPVGAARASELRQLGNAYLARVRRLDDAVRAASIASYENGGLEAVFTAMQRFERWDKPLLRAFRHFLSKHVEFDSDLASGHGPLCRHLHCDDEILPLWQGFAGLLVDCAPALRG